jgi:hypothetical protein
LPFFAPPPTCLPHLPTHLGEPPRVPGIPPIVVEVGGGPQIGLGWERRDPVHRHVETIGGGGPTEPGALGGAGVSVGVEAAVPIERLLPRNGKGRVGLPGPLRQEAVLHLPGMLGGVAARGGVGAAGTLGSARERAPSLLVVPLAAIVAARGKAGVGLLDEAGGGTLFLILLLWRTGKGGEGGGEGVAEGMESGPDQT